MARHYSPKPDRRGVRGLWLCLLLLLGVARAGEELPPVTIPPLDDLAATAAEATARRLPIVLFFAAEHCSYCEQVAEDFLKPMLRSGDYDERMILRRVELDVEVPLRDLDGSEVTPAALARRYRVFVTPTLVFIDGRGRQLAPPLVGIASPDYYGADLDAAIERALVAVRRPPAAGQDGLSVPSGSGAPRPRDGG